MAGFDDGDEVDERRLPPSAESSEKSNIFLFDVEQITTVFG